MTTTTLINGVTVGVTASPYSNITKWTLAANSVAVSLQVSLTPTVSEAKSVRVWWARTPDSFTANAAAVENFKRGGSANFIATSFNLPAGIATIESSEMEPALGGFVLVWVEEPVLGGSATLTVKGTEN